MGKEIVYATKANMVKYHAKYGNRLVMHSPYDDGEYSADPSDYWNVPSSHRFKDSTGHVMRLTVKVPARHRQLTVSKKAKRPKGKK